MASTVKFIFITLMKVPLLVIAAFFLFNIFAFSISLFQVMTLTNVAKQVAVENNFIPPEERHMFQRHMNFMSSRETLSNVRFTDNTNFTRAQYGNNQTIGIEAQFHFIFPLLPNQQRTGDGFVIGMQDTDRAGLGVAWLDEIQLEQERELRRNNPLNMIRFEFQVPGLRYYPDLS